MILLIKYDAEASNIKAMDFLTISSQEPDLGNLFEKDGKRAKIVKGIENVSPKPNIPIKGSKTLPWEALINKDPTKGPVHEKDNKVIASAIKNAPAKPPFSALVLTLLVRL